MENFTTQSAATATTKSGAAAIGKALGRLSCGGDMHFDKPAQPFTPSVTLEMKVGNTVVGTAEITGFDVRREQVGPHGTRLLILANEAD